MDSKLAVPEPAHPRDQIAGVKTAIKRPTEIARFSLDENRLYHYDDSQLRYYYPPNCDARRHINGEGLSLADGFETFRAWDDSQDEHIDFLLRSLIDLEREKGEKVTAGLVCYRGLLTKVLCAPYSDDGFEFLATSFQDTVYMEQDHAYVQASKASNHSPPVMTYSGYKFEALATLPDTWHNCTRAQIENRNADPVSNYAQYASVVSSTVSGIPFIIGGEVDALAGVLPTDPAGRREQYVELKTCTDVPPTAKSFTRRLLKFWAQSFLLGVPSLIIGFRTVERDVPMLQHIQTFRTTDIPRLVREEFKGFWRSDVCLGFLGAFLQFLRETVHGDGVWRVSLKAGRPGERRAVTVLKEVERGHGRILTDEWLAWRSAGHAESGRNDQPVGPSTEHPSTLPLETEPRRPDTPPSC